MYVDYALRFINSDADRPWFVYLPFNCPHAPFQIADEYAAPYEQLDMKPSDFPQTDAGHPTERLSGNTAKVYGMVENIDENVGRMLAKVDELGQRENTIVVLLHDNGANGNRYDCGLKAHKGSVYEGGIRSFFFIRWPARLKPGHVVRQIAAHVDVPPTLLDAAGMEPPADVAMDGRSLLPLLEGRTVDWPNRTLFLQWHRGDRPERYRACAARSQNYKIVRPGPGGNFQLYDMRRDPFETHDIAAEHPEVVKRLKKEYDAWFNSVSNERSGFAPPRIVVGTPHENPVVLTRQDWRLPDSQRGWGRCGQWKLSVPKPGTFHAECLLARPTKRPATATLTVQDIEQTIDLEPGARRFEFEPFQLAANGTTDLQVRIRERGQANPRGPYHVYLSASEN